MRSAGRIVAGKLISSSLLERIYVGVIPPMQGQESRATAKRFDVSWHEGLQDAEQLLHRNPL